MNLSIFNDLDFLQALKAFFHDLNVPINYVDDKPTSAKQVLEDTYKDNEAFKLINDVYLVGLVDDAAFKRGKSLAIAQIKSDYDGILVFGITLRNREHNLLPTRSQLAEISRAFNREFYYTPVVVVFKYGEYLAFANTERLKYKDNREGEKAGKVTLLRDIDIRQPHSGHERILANLAIATTGKNKVDSFASLYKYWQEVLSVSLLNKKFYQDLSNWYFWAVGRVTFPAEPTSLEAQAKKVSLEDLIKEHKSKNVIRLLTRLLFVWFIKEKGLIPPELFELDDLQKNILKNISPYNDLGLFKQVNQESIYYRAILQNLFFATLNCPIKPMESHDNRVRGFRKMDNYGQHRDANFLMRYEKHFQSPDRFVEMVNSVVPFLNGGLFECLDDKLNKVYIDGFSDNLAKGEQLIVPDYLFFGVEEKVDLSAEYGLTNKATKEAAVKGLINILKAYKFTITENTPIEEDVALDPELLGKVFENLLASYNPETKTTARKQTGSFYTPREIVNYMVDESLIAYLKNELLAQESGYQEEELDRQLRQLVSFDAVNPFAGNTEAQKRIIKALDKCTILDPACGSGAFPMGILQKMVHILFKVDPKNTEWKQRQIVRVEAAIGQLEGLEDAQYREQGIQDLNAQIKDIEEAFANNELDYGRKLYLIENCIYGVDIQSIATQISKLRFFISLVVDQRVDQSKDNFGIRPLPNLETKFVAANTLIGIEKPKAQLILFDTPEIKKLEADLKKVRHRLFSSKSPSHKRKLRDQDKALREQIAVVLQKNGWETDTANKLANWDPYNLNDSASFFDPEWMFGMNDGFNICIGNPPYGGALTKKEVEYFKKTYTLKTSETAILFIEKGKYFLKSNGLLTYIVPKSYSFASNYATTRDFTIQELLLTVDCGKAFENVLLEAMVFLLRNNEKQKYYNSVSFDGRDFLAVSTVNKSLVKEFSFILNGITEKEISIASKIRKSGKFLNDVATNTRGDALQKFIDEDEGHYYVIGGAEINEYGIKSFKGLIDESNIVSEKGYIRNNSLLAQNIVAHIKNPFEHIKITACIPINTTDYLITDTINQIVITDKSYSQKFIWALLKSNIVNWFTYYFILGKAIRTIHFDSPITARIPIPTAGESDKLAIDKVVSYVLYLTEQLKDVPTIGKGLEQASADKVMTQYFEKIIDAMVFELYFSDHMKEKKIDVLQFIQRDIAEVMQGKVFENLEDTAKQKVIEQLYAKWTDPDNEVRDRMKLFAVRSPDVLKPILESK